MSLRETLIFKTDPFEGRGVETVGPVVPLGHRHLRSNSSTVLPDQMSERA